jgi:hypothetical protein
MLQNVNVEGVESQNRCSSSLKQAYASEKKNFKQWLLYSSGATVVLLVTQASGFKWQAIMLKI